MEPRRENPALGLLETERSGLQVGSGTFQRIPAAGHVSFMNLSFLILTVEVVVENHAC